MVDSIGNGGHIPKVQSSSSVQKQTDRNKVEQGSPAAVASSDDVAISDEALSLSAAQNIAKDIGSQISANGDLTLSLDNDRLNSLA